MSSVLSLFRVLFPSFQSRLLLLVIMAIMPLIGMLLLGALLDRGSVLQTARQRVLAMAQLGAEQQDDMLQEARTLLGVLSQVDEIRSASEDACSALLARLEKSHSRIEVMSKIDATGRVSCSSAPSIVGRSLQDLRYVQLLLTPGHEGYEIGDLVTSRITGNAMVYVGLTLPDTGGGPGMLSAGMNLGWLSSIAAKILPEGRNKAMVIDTRDGSLLASFPPNANKREGLPADSPILRAARSEHGKAGVVQGIGMDGIERVYGFAPLPGTNGRTVLTIGLALDEMLATANRRMMYVVFTVVVVTAVAIVLTLLAAWVLLVRPGTRIAAVATRLGRGDLAARISLPNWHARELHVLAGALNAMAGGFAEAQALLADREARFRRLAGTDGLTGIANRRLFDEALVTEWQRARREGKELSVLLLDVDQFKRFNDLHGHLAGDDCLRSVAGAIASVLRRPGDMVARFGGEEFVVLLPGTGAVGAADVAERLRGAVEAARIGAPDSSSGLGVTVSVGVATGKPTLMGQTLVEAVVAEADQALYMAKNAGRNRVATCIGTPTNAEARLPASEAERLVAVSLAQVSDTGKLDRLARLAAGLLGAPIGMVSLVGSDDQVFVGRWGIAASGSPRSTSFCGHAILNEQVFVVPDALQDVRFADNPWVTGGPMIRFYAGAPLLDATGQHRLGTLCVIDRVPRPPLDAAQRALLTDLAALASDQLREDGGGRTDSPTVREVSTVSEAE